MSEKLKNIFDPPEKVQRIYEAISELVQENREIAALKVQEITSRAGIGKGTAYEYFSSKEEIILHAGLWICFQQNRELLKELEKYDDFQSKFMFLLGWMENHKEQNELLIKALKGSFHGECTQLKELIPEGLIEKAKEYMTRQMNQLFDLGYREGIITIQDVEKRMIVFFGTMMQYRFMSGMNKEEHKQFIYECMVKSLN
mgnify:CR=1 FL=1